MLASSTCTVARAKRVPARVIVAGAGVAGLETVLALREGMGDSIAIDLISPNDGFVYRPLAVAEPFGLTPQFEIDLQRFAHDTQIKLHHDELVSVDPEAKRVRTASRKSLGFDYLVVAIGAIALPGLRGAFTFMGPESVGEYRRLLYRIERGEVGSLAFTVPAGLKWLLPIYELALMTAAFARARLAQLQTTLVTPEALPLESFGFETAKTAIRTVHEWGIELVTEHHPVRFEGGRLETDPGSMIFSDAVVSLPRLEGPALSGLPADNEGFLQISGQGRVPRCDGIFAVGDATTFPIKQGGIAAQEADAVAEVIACDLGRIAEPAPFRPMLDAVLLTGELASHLHRSLTSGTITAPRDQVGDAWWPLGKISARHLGSYLADRAGIGSTSAALQPESLSEELKATHETHIRARVSP